MPCYTPAHRLVIQGQLKGAKMNKVTQDIAKMAVLELKDAWLVQEFIDENVGLDWSEASNNQIKKAVSYAIKEMQAK